jgi:hypothetical protein
MNEAKKIEAAEAASLAMPSPGTPGGALPSKAMPDRAVPNSALPRRGVPCRDPASYHRKLDRLLDRMGSLYTAQDILTAIAEGKMQSFTVNNSWVVTKVADFPRARQLELIAYVGDLADVDALHAKILAYADEVNAGLLSTYGRRGWLREGSYRRLGWRLKARNQLYVKEL